jgi:hypothetical protein
MEQWHKTVRATIAVDREKLPFDTCAESYQM